MQLTVNNWFEGEGATLKSVGDTADKERQLTATARERERVRVRVESERARITPRGKAGERRMPESLNVWS